ncbi:hypothetical protein [Vibrio phage RYC]|nr:hypothetical protein [Vibrio phage RYC]
MSKISLENGKYVINNNNGIVTVRRFGEEWRDLTGDSLFLSLIQEVERLHIDVHDREALECAASDIARDRHKGYLGCEKYIQDCGDHFEIERYDNDMDYTAGTSFFHVTKEEARDRYLANKEEYQ